MQQFGADCLTRGVDLPGAGFWGCRPAPVLVPAGIGRNLFVAIPPCCAAPYVQFFVWSDSFLFLFFFGLVFPDPVFS